MADGTIKTSKTVFDIIETIEKLDGAGISEIAEEVGKAPSTVHNHLQTLHEMEYLCHKGNEFHIGLKFLNFGIYAKERIKLTEYIQPTLSQLAADTGESAWVIVEEHGRSVNLEGETGERGVRTAERIGWRSYLHVHAAGKTILAYLPEQRTNEIINQWDLPQLTEHTITDQDELMSEFETIREQGYARDDGEGIEGLRAVAAPIIVDDTVYGAVTVAAPANRMKGDQFRDIVPNTVLGAANEIELKLKYQ